VVNVGQRTGLYRTIERLEEGGLVAVRATGRDQQYPERTVYEITDAGRAATRAAARVRRKTSACRGCRAALTSAHITSLVAQLRCPFTVVSRTQGRG
jgi:DNA-binding PadR family transcriptional regulator